MQLLDGKLISKQVKNEIAEECKFLKEKGIVPHLAAILVGNDGASESYVSSKVKDCAEVGFKSSLFRFDTSVSEKELLEKIIDINNNSDINGLIVQLPLPKHISVEKVTNTISPKKDVDGFHPENIGKMNKGLDTFISATPLGILMMLEKSGIETSGKHCVVIGRSQIVGSPISILMARNAYPGNCTVTLCHSKTVDLKKYTLSADILIVALGKPEFLKAEMVKEGAIVIDVGISRIEKPESKKGFVISGDVDFDSVAPKCSYISPVPGGVGPMTRVGLLKNTLIAAKKLIENKK